MFTYADVINVVLFLFPLVLNGETLVLVVVSLFKLKINVEGLFEFKFEFEPRASKFEHFFNVHVASFL